MYVSGLLFRGDKHVEEGSRIVDILVGVTVNREFNDLRAFDLLFQKERTCDFLNAAPTAIENLARSLETRL